VPVASATKFVNILKQDHLGIITQKKINKLNYDGGETI
jgi:hypothetical protein